MNPDGALSPGKSEFRELAKSRRVIPVTMTIMVDSLSAVGLFTALCGDRAGTFLLESAEAGVRWSRYSFIGVRSAAMLTDIDGMATWVGRVPVGMPTSGSGLDALKQTLALLHTPGQVNELPFSGGLVGYLAYDAVRHWEDIGENTTDDLQIPDLSFLMATDMAVVDHLAGTVTLIANAINYDNSPDRVDDAYQDCVSRVNDMLEKLNQVSLFAPEGAHIFTDQHHTEIGIDVHFDKKVEIVKEYIRAGDAFQVVLSQRFSVECQTTAFNVYRTLRATNPSPYMYLLRIPSVTDFDKTEFEIVGSSPEALVTVQSGLATSHPIAGTRWRSNDPDEDRRLAHEMLSDEKERAEHLMLVDLARNDLGKVCVPGSVNVIDFMHVERYSHVMHLVSTVTGSLASDSAAFDVLRATFPAGTLSGAPKPRAMQIIEELETSRRGLYGGCVGYFDFAGNMDMAIAIRTALIRDNIAHIQAGAGIVADSVPVMESNECVNKAQGVVSAVDKAQGLRSL